MQKHWEKVRNKEKRKRKKTRRKIAKIMNEQNSIYTKAERNTWV